jgi:hypothetical protein
VFASQSKGGEYGGSFLKHSLAAWPPGLALSDYLQNLYITTSVGLLGLFLSSSCYFLKKYWARVTIKLN